ncbi:MAG: hypothetical protein HJJLKODD_02141 [Phycisphaerae bacterium]|nr:hypothetical protein [Phycisphaerae bacterium]
MTRYMASKLAQLHSKVAACRLCPRLVECREKAAREKMADYRNQKYWGRGVPGFGRIDARLVILGLAPGAHGANRTGRVFSGDASGDFLFAGLYQAGLANHLESVARDDGLALEETYITNVVKCAPPHNRPNHEELTRCRDYLREELRLLKQARCYLCLGRTAYKELQEALGVTLGPFQHGLAYELDHRHLLCSYHVSRQNTHTGRLTPHMFSLILQQAKQLGNLGHVPNRLTDQPLPILPPPPQPLLPPTPWPEKPWLDGDRSGR